MDLQQLQDEVEKRLPAVRFQHVLGVVETAQQLAEEHGESVENAKIAALLHDVMKFTDRRELKALLESHNCDERIFSYHHELWHGPAGAIVAQEEFGIDNKDILHAIQFHTTGRANMSPLEKIIYIADLVEPGRKLPAIDKLRAQLTGDLNNKMALCVHHTLQFLLSKKVAIFPDSLDCYNEHMMREEK